MHARSRSTAPAPEICVVGAGLAGLRCADILLQHGFKVTVLEARDRIGGRAHQEALPSGHLVDLGPNWIHGTDHNPILDLAKTTKTAMHTWGEELNVFGEKGEVLPQGREISEVMWKFIAQAFKYSSQNTSTIDLNESLKDFFETKFLEEFPGEEDLEKKKILMQLAEFWGAFVGSPVHRQSLKFFWLEECIDGGVFLQSISQSKCLLVMPVFILHHPPSTFPCLAAPIIISPLCNSLEHVARRRLTR